MNRGKSTLLGGVVAALLSVAAAEGEESFLGDGEAITMLASCLAALATAGFAVNYVRRRRATNKAIDAAGGPLLLASATPAGGEAVEAVSVCEQQVKSAPQPKVAPGLQTVDWSAYEGKAFLV